MWLATKFGAVCEPKHASPIGRGSKTNHWPMQQREQRAKRLVLLRVKDSSLTAGYTENELRAENDAETTLGRPDIHSEPTIEMEERYL
jgi:hypothetical protein